MYDMLYGCHSNSALRKRLHGDNAVRAALQNVRAASLLPPVGTEVFRRLTPASLGRIQERRAAESVERETRTKNKEVQNIPATFQQPLTRKLSSREVDGSKGSLTEILKILSSLGQNL